MSAYDLGRWELDTVVSSRGKSKACKATFVERKTQMFIASAHEAFMEELSHLA